MANIVVIAESGADIPQDLAEKYGIEVVPMHVSFNDVSKDDGSFDQDEIIQFYEKTGSVPKTSGCMPNDFALVYDRVRQQQPDAHMVYLAYSSVTTCSFESARIAADGSDDITFIDTKHVTIGQGAVVIRFCELLEQNPDWTLEEAIACANELCAKVRTSFLPCDLKYLVAGGRLSNAVAVVGSLLRIRPRIDLLDGLLVAGKKYRGSEAKCVASFISSMVEEENLDRSEIWVAASPRITENSLITIEATLHDLGFMRIRWTKTGGVISTHGGPNAFAIAGFAK